MTGWKSKWTASVHKLKLKSSDMIDIKYFWSIIERIKTAQDPSLTTIVDLGKLFIQYI